MDRIWQWAWDRYGARYSWAICAISFPWCCWSIWLGVSHCRCRGFRSLRRGGRCHRCRRAGAAVRDGSSRRWARAALVEQWAAGREIDQATALDATYAWARGRLFERWWSALSGVALLSIVVGAIAGATGSRLLQYGILGAAVGAASS